MCLQMDLILIWATATVFFPIMRKIWEILIAPEKKKKNPKRNCEFPLSFTEVFLHVRLNEKQVFFSPSK